MKDGKGAIFDRGTCPGAQLSPTPALAMEGLASTALTKGVTMPLTRGKSPLSS
ncbi:MAG: hypothetical protein ACOYMP_04565 [Nodosilinea sp.]